MENKNHIKCLNGICEGLTWNESKIIIVQKHGYHYWTEWVNRVTWSPNGIPVRRQRCRGQGG